MGLTNVYIKIHKHDHHSPVTIGNDWSIFLLDYIYYSVHKVGCRFFFDLFYLYLVRFSSIHKVVTMQSHLYIIFNFQFSKYDLACTISFIALCNSSQSLFGMELSIQLIILSFFVFGILRSQTLYLSLLK